ncbi:cyclic nucleotide-binding domain-containing protein [Marinomonas sp. 15G1-11]|uniref:Cyclic nucleotide-binding domain-containing protein n=1 Tax=Marinomonas phaeophyticola TaxID=3004091 RepID=A0ABT4JRI9_9GAMM|nr:GDSL-type esterase/lipase family protein [Marinomonas sp. 15G1-11]MCZ2720791.1 cyclic nucleotide-binding domain-containing protein [Marinomonas sp. 15G1-11]
MDVANTVRQLPFLENASESIIESITSMARLVTLTQNNVLIKHFDPGNTLYFLIEGKLSISIPSKETSEEHEVGTISEIYTPIGWSALRYPSRYATTFTTLENTTLISLPILELKTLLDEELEFGNHFLHFVYQTCLSVLADIQNKTKPFFSNESLAFDETRPFNKEGVSSHNLLKAQEVLAASPFFEGFTETNIHRFAKSSLQLLVHQGDIISQQNQYADGLYVLLNGKVIVRYQTETGEIITTRTISRKSALLGWCTTDEDILNRTSMIASRDSTILYISREHIRKILLSDQALNLKYWYRLIWLVGTHLLAARMRYLSQASNNEVFSVTNVVEQNAALLPVTSPLYKIGKLLKSPVTTDEAFGLLYKSLHFGNTLERTISGMCLDILRDVQRENGFYRHLQRTYDDITQLPSDTPATDVRRKSVSLFDQAFQQVPYVIKGLENLPKKPGSLFIYNHLNHSASTCLPNGFQFPIDAQFISSMIIDKQYGVSGIRVVRRSQKDEYWRDDYYKRFGNLFVNSWESLSSDEELNQLFIQAGQAALKSNTPLLIAPEGTGFSTDESPGLMRTPIFNLAASMGAEEPWIVPIAVANFDKRVDHTVYSVVIKPAFKLSSKVDISNVEEVAAFVKEYQSTFRGYVEEAIQLAEAISATPDLSYQEGYRSNVKKLNQLEVEFESDVRELEFRLAQKPYEDNPVAFYGSTTIRNWPELTSQLGRNDIINLGFSAATLESCVYYFERIVLPQKPRSLVLYAGDNDIGNLHSSNRVLELYIELLQKVDSHLPHIPVTIISIKPSPSRSQQYDTIVNTNESLKRLAKTRPNTQYVDLFSLLLDDDGKIKTNLFEDDLLHLNARGYKLWSKNLKFLQNFIFDSNS